MIQLSRSECGGEQGPDRQGRGIGIWSVNDNGDAPPRWILMSPKVTSAQAGTNVALNPKAKEPIMGSDSGFTAYSLPEIF